MNTNIISKARQEMDIALEGLKTVETNEELEEAKKIVDIAKTNLLNVSDEFRSSTQHNMEAMRTQAMMGMSPQMGMGIGMSAMPMSMGVPRGGMTQSPISLKHEEIWACRRCGSKNVNWKIIGNRKQQRTYRKKMTLSRSLIVNGSVRYCMKCSQELKRDILLEKISLSDLQLINQKVHKESLDSVMGLSKGVL